MILFDKNFQKSLGRDEVFDGMQIGKDLRNVFYTVRTERNGFMRVTHTLAGLALVQKGIDVSEGQGGRHNIRKTKGHVVPDFRQKVHAFLVQIT